MIVAIVGSRDFPDLDAVRDAVDDLPRDTVVISGGARGVDACAISHARSIGLQTEEYPADWATYGRGAGFKRNKVIAERCDRMIAFWHNDSRGTEHVIGVARELGKPVQVITYTTDSAI